MVRGACERCGSRVAPLRSYQALKTRAIGQERIQDWIASVKKRVLELFAELKANGWVVKGITAAATRGGEAWDGKQAAHFGSSGKDYAVVARLY